MNETCNTQINLFISLIHQVVNQRAMQTFITKHFDVFVINPLIATLKPQNNGPLCSNTVIGTLAVDEWAGTFGTAMRGLGGLRPRPVPSSLCQM